ncbi:MAG: hypothetical protein ABI624_00295 [Casimicrobiaceae bacterium]
MTVVAPAAPAAPKVPAPIAALSYFRAATPGYEWLIWRADQVAPAVFLRAETQPRLVYWDSSDRQVYYAVGDALYRARFDETSARPEAIGTLPQDVGEVRVLWRDRANGRLRLVAMQGVAAADVVMRNGKPQYRTARGTLLPGMRDPDWGNPFVCSVLELAADGKTWKLVAQRATKDEAGDTPGMSVVDDLRHERGTSTDRLLRSYTCDNNQCRNDVPTALIGVAAKHAGRTLGDDDVSLWQPVRRLPTIVFGTVMGDQLHMTPPVLLTSGTPGAAVALPVGERSQIGLGIDQGLLLVADEGTGDRPIVFDLATGQTRFAAADGRSSTWMPLLAPRR